MRFDAVKWIMGIVAALLVAGATAWAANMQSSISALEDRERVDLEFRGEIRTKLDDIQRTLEELKR